MERRVIETLNPDIQYTVKISSNVFQTDELNRWHSLQRSDIYSVNEIYIGVLQKPPSIVTAPALKEDTIYRNEQSKLQKELDQHFDNYRKKAQPILNDNFKHEAKRFDSIRFD